MDRIGQNWNGEDKTGQDGSHKDRTGQASTRLDGEILARRYNTGLDKAEQVGQNGTGRARQDWTRLNRAGQDEAGMERSGQGRSGQDRTGQDRTGQDKTRRNGKGLHGIALVIEGRD